MTSDSETNRPIDETERQKLLNELIKERFGDWAINKVPEIKNHQDISRQNLKMSLPDFIHDAPCRSADPWLFDQHQIDLAQPALAYCSRCKYHTECDALVQPRQNHYDGIVAGKVWRNGRVLARLDTTSPNRLTVGEEPLAENDYAMDVRGSELLGDRDELLLPREEFIDGGIQTSQEDLQWVLMERRVSDLCTTLQSGRNMGRNKRTTKKTTKEKTKHNSQTNNE